ncbi:hypothetical protein C0J52_10335 [Blattella germanica]|nr:hypothetical protein C0J52_10335 [Blattella germanica]
MVRNYFVYRLCFSSGYILTYSSIFPLVLKAFSSEVSGVKELAFSSLKISSRRRHCVCVVQHATAGVTYNETRPTATFRLQVSVNVSCQQIVTTDSTM